MPQPAGFRSENCYPACRECFTGTYAKKTQYLGCMADFQKSKASLYLDTQHCTNVFRGALERNYYHSIYMELQFIAQSNNKATEYEKNPRFMETNILYSELFGDV